MKRLITLILLLGLLSVACGPGSPMAVPSPASPTDSSGPTQDPSSLPRPSASPSRPSPSPPGPDPSPTRSPTPKATQAGTIPASLVGTQWYTLPTSKKVVALTFDAGANADGVPSILATLAENGVPATFFLTGKWVEVYPAYAAQIGAAFPVANHSYSHPDLAKLSDAEVTSEITRAASVIKGATGDDTHPMFRFPFGASSQHAVDLVNDLGYGCLNWTVDTRGWMGTSGGQTEDSVVQAVLDAARPGEIVIMHVGSNPDDGSTLDADALTRVIDGLRALGYSFVTIDRYL